MSGGTLCGDAGAPHWGNLLKKGPWAVLTWKALCLGTVTAGQVFLNLRIRLQSSFSSHINCFAKYLFNLFT